MVFDFMIGFRTLCTPQAVRNVLKSFSDKPSHMCQKMLLNVLETLRNGKIRQSITLDNSERFEILSLKCLPWFARISSNILQNLPQRFNFSFGNL